MMLTIDIQKVDFDPDVLQLRVSGTVQSENDLVRLGAHHTLTLELNQNFSIERKMDHISRSIDEAIHPERQGRLLLRMQTDYARLSCHGAIPVRIDMNIPKKRKAAALQGDYQILRKCVSLC
jgi:protein pelota